MSHTEKYRKRLMELIRAGMSPDQAADDCMSGLSREELFEIARPALRYEARRVKRDLVRQKEREAFARLGRAKFEATPRELSPAPLPVERATSPSTPIRVSPAPLASAGGASGGSTAKGVSPLPQTGVEELRGLLRESFSLKDGTRCYWATATREQHLARAAWLRELARGSVTTAEQHEYAAKAIKQARVKTLGDLLGEKAAA